MLATSTENSCQNSSSRCVGACETLRICAQLEKGKCEFELGGVAVTRILYNYEFKIENCDAHPITITFLKLNMLRRVIAVTEGGNELLVTNVEDPMSNVSPSFNRPEWKLLSLESVCGTANSSDFTGNIDGISLAAPPDEKITLVLTPFTIQPGDCCVSLVFAVDFRTSDNLIIYTEPSVLCLAAQRRIGYDCCILEHSLSIPGECNLRSDRNSTYYVE